MELAGKIWTLNNLSQRRENKSLSDIRLKGYGYKLLNIFIVSD